MGFPVGEKKAMVCFNRSQALMGKSNQHWLGSEENTIFENEKTRRRQGEDRRDKDSERF